MRDNENWETLRIELNCIFSFPTINNKIYYTSLPIRDRFRTQSNIPDKAQGWNYPRHSTWLCWSVSVYLYIYNLHMNIVMLVYTLQWSSQRISRKSLKRLSRSNTHCALINVDVDCRQVERKRHSELEKHCYGSLKNQNWVKRV